MLPESKKSHYDPHGISDWKDWTNLRKHTQWMRRRWSKMMRRTKTEMIDEGKEEFEKEKSDIKAEMEIDMQEFHGIDHE